MIHILSARYPPQSRLRPNLVKITIKSIKNSSGFTDAFFLRLWYNELVISGRTAKQKGSNTNGRQQGQENPYDDCGDLVDKYRPNGLDNKY